VILHDRLRSGYVQANLDTFRVFLHLLGVTVWIGGQIVVAGLIPVARKMGPDAPRTIATVFGKVAWPFFGLAVVTGIWNILAIDMGKTSTGYQVALGIKLLLVTLSGVAAFFHTKTSNPGLRGVTAGLALLCGLVAMFVGVGLS
jgi:putative copper export protein